jgi:cation transport ATPase
MDIGRDLSQYNGEPSHPGHKLLADPANYAAIESDLVFVGLVGLQDPPRPEVAGAIKQVSSRNYASVMLPVPVAIYLRRFGQVVHTL